MLASALILYLDDLRQDLLSDQVRHINSGPRPVLPPDLVPSANGCSLAWPAAQDFGTSVREGPGCINPKLASFKKERTTYLYYRIQMMSNAEITGTDRFTRNNGQGAPSPRSCLTGTGERRVRRM